MSLIRLSESAPFRAIHPIRKALLNPVLSGSLLLALLYAPQDVRQNIFKKLTIPETYDITVAKKVLQAVFGLGVISYINQTLSKMASNSWRLSAAPGWDWPKEVAVVTGGSSGIGLRLVELLLTNRIKVAVLDIQPPPKTIANNPNVKYFQCDIASVDAVKEAAKGVREAFGHPTILVNNAGIAQLLPILDMPIEKLRKIFDINTLSHWTLVQQFLPNMIENNKGHVITVASLASFVALGPGADYSCTKASALAFHESLKAELHAFYDADKVLTTVVHPHFVKTPLVKDFASNLEAAGVNLLTVDDIAVNIHKQILSRCGGQLILPERATPISALRGWPTWMQVNVRNTVAKIGVNTVKNK